MENESAVMINDVKNHIDQVITINGWVFSKRSSGSVIFLQIRDGNGFIQAVISKNAISDNEFSIADSVTIESAITLSGIVKEDKRSPYGFELQVNNFKLISSGEGYPISQKAHTADFLLSNRHLWLRSRRQWAILRIRNRIINAINEYLQGDNYIRIDSPIITPSACEGTTTLFSIDYFGKPAYLSQSGQLYLEAAIYSVGKCYDFGPVFRAEKSKTKRHLIEFWMMDAEAAFTDFNGILSVEEKMIHYIIQAVLKDCSIELAIINRDIKPLEKITIPFPRLRYEEVVKKLGELGSDIKLGEDLGNDDETILMNHYDQPLFITNFPSAFKAFYFKRDPENDNSTMSADMLAPEGYGEIIGGGEREPDYDVILKRIKENNYNIADYSWYLDLRKYGSVPHSGFGLGLERIVAWICKLNHVRESIPFPRLLSRFNP
ncbi:MAG: asparagine--tRNA ligase [bacterium]